VTVVMDPDRDGIDGALRSFIVEHGQKPNNRLLFYFAGHGHSIKSRYGGAEDYLGYLVPVDAPNPNLDRTGFLTKAFSIKSMEVHALNIQSKHALFVFDACFAGTIFNATRAIPAAIAEKTGRPVRQFITSGTAEQEVPDVSVFRRQFIAALGGEADGDGDGYLTGSELGYFLETTVTNYTGRSQTPQYGKLRHAGLDKGDFVFALPEAEREPTTATDAPPAAPGDSDAAEVVFWQSIQDSTDPKDFEAYLRQVETRALARLADQRPRQAPPETETVLVVPPPPRPELEPVEAAYVAVKTANVREAPTVRAAKVGRIDQGTKVHVAGKVRGQNWYLVERDDKPLGYVFGELLRKAEPMPGDTPSGRDQGSNEPAPESAVALAVPRLKTPTVASPEIGLDAARVILLDFATGTVLFEKNADVPMAPASMTKIMTLYLLFQRLEDGRLALDDTLPVSQQAWRIGGSKMFVEAGTRVAVEDLIRGIVVQSGNDASIVVAEGLAGTEERFAEEMTATARRLGLTHTTFRNATGWPDPEHVTTARDLAVLAVRTIRDFPDYYHYYGERTFTYNDIRQGNRNPLLYKDMGADGLKTGHTEASGYSLTASAVRNGRRLVLVLSGPESVRARTGESAKLIDWGFDALTKAAFAPRPPTGTQTREDIVPAVGVYPSTRRPGETFRDCAECPEMVVVPAGNFTMGSPASETTRESVPDEYASRERPQHRVTIARSFALGKYEVTRAEFAAFVGATGRDPGGCWFWDGSEAKDDSSKSWRDPGFTQTERDPVACVSWGDAREYVRWLSNKTGQDYGLPSEAEWEYAARAGTTTARYWGEDPDSACGYGNVHDRTSKAENQFVWPNHDCRDGHANTAPVGSFQANRFGLHDVLGNVGEWVEDCWNENYSGAPTDGAAWTTGECAPRVLRGGSWYDHPRDVRTAIRDRYNPGVRDYGIGFRISRTLP
jgi:D-alanyl-D-alanine carboxypeptidase